MPLGRFFLYAVLIAAASLVARLLPFQKGGWGPDTAQSPAFEVIGPEARRLNYQWKPLPFLQTPVATFLFNVSGSLVLVDAGPPGHAVPNLLSQLRAAAATTPLRLLLGKTLVLSGNVKSP